METYGFWIACLAALLSCFFSANHYALHYFSRSKLEDILAERGKTGRLKLLSGINGYLLLTGVFRAALNLLILVLVIADFAPPAESSSWTQMTLAFVAAGALIAIFGVTIPHSWGRYAAEQLLAFSLPLLRGLAVVCAPLMAVLKWFDPLIRRLLGVAKPSPNDATELEQEILDAVSEGEKTGLVDEAQAHMIEAIVEFPGTTVEEIMTPRTDVVGLEAGATLAEIKRLVREKGHSRLPVYSDNLDEIIGVLYVKDLLRLVGDNGDEPFDLRNSVRPAVFVPESKTLRDLLAEMQARKVHLAMVLDEYGGTSGLVTIEDILEEIVGEIQDEYEPDTKVEPSIQQIDGSTAEADGRVYIDDVNDTLDIDLPEDEDFDTIGGFVFSTLGHIPEVGEKFDYENVTVTVTDAEKTRVNRVRIEVRDRRPRDEAEQTIEPST